jgi:hypothetical protein
MEGAVDTLAVPSDEHTPLSEMVINFKPGSKEYSPPGGVTEPLVPKMRGLETWIVA